MKASTTCDELRIIPRSWVVIPPKMKASTTTGGYASGDWKIVVIPSQMKASTTCDELRIIPRSWVVIPPQNGGFYNNVYVTSHAKSVVIPPQNGGFYNQSCLLLSTFRLSYLPKMEASTTQWFYNCKFFYCCHTFPNESFYN